MRWSIVCSGEADAGSTTLRTQEQGEGSKNSRTNSRRTVDHRVQEEEGEMFPKVRILLSNEALETLGKRLEAARKDFRKTARAA